MDCTKFNTNIFGYLEGDLSSGLRKEMDEHLSACLKCPVILAGFQSEMENIRRKRSAEPTPFTSTRIMQRIENEFYSEARPARPFYLHIPRPVLAFLVILIGIISGFSLGIIGTSSYTSGQQDELRLEQIKAELSMSDFTIESETFFIKQ